MSPAQITLANWGVLSLGEVYRIRKANPIVGRPLLDFAAPLNALNPHTPLVDNKDSALALPCAKQATDGPTWCRLDSDGDAKKLITMAMDLADGGAVRVLSWETYLCNLGSLGDVECCLSL